MKSTFIAIGSLFAVAAVAQPHRHQQHHHEKRHGGEHGREDVVWVTDYDYVTETVDVTTTIWVSSGFVAPTTSSEAVPTTSAVAAEFFQPAVASSSSVYVAPAPSSSSVYVAPPPPSTPVAPAPSSSVAPAYVAPPAPASSSSSVYVAPPAAAAPPSSSPAPVAAPEPTTSAAPADAAPTTSAAPAVASTPAASSSSSSGGQCGSGSPCTGDITYYEAGLGACGLTNDGNTENVVALPHGLMGTQSNGNPYCGKTITIKCKATGKTTTAKVVDKCMGCEGYSIDLSNAAFLELDDLSVGRTTADWWFN